MRISDWSSDVCSSDLSILEWSEPIGGWKIIALIPQIIEPYRWTAGYLNGVINSVIRALEFLSLILTRGSASQFRQLAFRVDRKRVVSGKSVSVRVDLGGRRIIKNKKKKHKPQY